MTVDLHAFIARLKAATEGSRELNAEIAELMGWTVEHLTTVDDIGEPVEEYEKWYKTDDWQNEYYFEPPPFTTSIDVALTLVPKGWVWCVSIDYEIPGQANLYNAVPGGKDDPPVRVQANGATPALALCIAALRAREEEE